MQSSIAHKLSQDTKHPQVVASPQAGDDDEPKAKDDGEIYTCVKKRRLTTMLQQTSKVIASNVSLRVSRHFAPAERLAFAPAEEALPYRPTPAIYLSMGL